MLMTLNYHMTGTSKCNTTLISCKTQVQVQEQKVTCKNFQYR